MIKKHLFFSLLLAAVLLCACTACEDSKTVVVVNIENADFDEAEIFYMKDFINYNRQTYTVNAEEESFRFEMEIEHPVTAYLSLGNQQLPLFLNHDASLTVYADMEQWQETLGFSGSLKDENRFMAAFRDQVEPKYNQRQMIDYFRDASPEEFAEFGAEMVREATNLLEEERFSTSETFNNYFLTEIHYQMFSNLLNYPVYHQYFNQAETTPKLPDDYYSFLGQAADFQDEKLFTSSYTSFLTEYLRHMIGQERETIPEGMSDFEKNMWMAEELLEGKTLDFARASLINFQLNHGDFETASEAYHEFSQLSTHPDLTDLLEETYESALKVSPGSEAPAFTLSDMEGSEVSLSDFRGQVVYLDFWASWCGPCMREVPYAKELKKRFQEHNDLVFLYISVDEDEEAWRNTVENHEIQGVHLNVNGMRHEVPNSYNVRGVPTFFLIDRDGFILDNNPSRPSGASIDNELKQALGLEV